MSYVKVSFENKTTTCIVFFSIISIYTLYQNGMLAQQLGNPTRSAKKLCRLKKKKKKKICLFLARERLPCFWEGL